MERADDRASRSHTSSSDAAHAGPFFKHTQKDCFSIQNTYFSIINPGRPIRVEKPWKFLYFYWKEKSGGGDERRRRSRRMLGIVFFFFVSFFIFFFGNGSRSNWNMRGVWLYLKRDTLLLFNSLNPSPKRTTRRRRREACERKRKKVSRTFTFRLSHRHCVWPEVLCAQLIDDRTAHSTKSQHESLETFECEIQLKFSNQRSDTAKPSASMSVFAETHFRVSV